MNVDRGVSRSASSVEADIDDDYVINRDGKREAVNLGKIEDKIKLLINYSGEKLKGVKKIELTKEIISRFKSGMSTIEVDESIVQVCNSMSGKHPDYSTLAARFVISNLHRTIENSFVEVYKKLFSHPKSRLSVGFMSIVLEFGNEIEDRIDLSRDYLNSRFSVTTLMKSYLLRDPDTSQVYELPQHMYMRVAIAILCMRRSREGEPEGGMPIESKELLRARLEQAFVVYNLLSTKKISHASPTIFNAGTIITQYSSCFLTQMDDSLKSIYDIISASAAMSKVAGGVSIETGRVRCEGSLIKSSGGKSSGLSGMYQVLNQSQEYANQGGRRPGAFALYLPIHHADVFTHLEMGRPIGPRYESRKDARFLKYALMVPDLFWVTLMKEIEMNELINSGQDVPPELDEAAYWYLFCPSDAPDLNEIYDEDMSLEVGDKRSGSFSKMYYQYIKDGKFKRRVRPLEIMEAITQTISITGNPYMIAKDNANRQSNLTIPATIEKNDSGDYFIADTGRAIVCSNLCAEIIIPPHTRDGKPEEDLHSVCNLAAINLYQFIEKDITSPYGVRMDWGGIIEAAGVLTVNLDNIIDLNFSPTEGCKRSNEFFRAIGIGVMGLADVFMAFGIAYGDKFAMELDAAIHACIYYGAALQSSMLAKSNKTVTDEHGNTSVETVYDRSFPAFPGSPASKGILQPDMAVACGILPSDWEDTICRITDGVIASDDWADLRVQVAKGIRNGYLIAPMPTATSSNGVGVNECFEPYTTLLYLRYTIAGEFTLMCPHLKTYLKDVWDENTSKLLVQSGGSVAEWDGSDPDLPCLSDETRRILRTAREIDQTDIILHAAARNPFISQSQSMNLYCKNVSMENITKWWLTGWKNGLKTLSYYVHSQAGSSDQSKFKKSKKPAPSKNKPDMPRAGTGCEGGGCAL